MNLSQLEILYSQLSERRRLRYCTGAFCHGTASLIQKTLDHQSIPSSLLWLQANSVIDGSSDRITVAFNDSSFSIDFGFHVAAMVTIDTGEQYILDTNLFERPVERSNWVAYFQQSLKYPYSSKIVQTETNEKFEIPIEIFGHRTATTLQRLELKARHNCAYLTDFVRKPHPFSRISI